MAGSIQLADISVLRLKYLSFIDYSSLLLFDVSVFVVSLAVELSLVSAFSTLAAAGGFFPA
jgi:hypothetical protein